MALSAVLPCGTSPRSVESNPVSVLQKVARCGDFWVQVHAIEFLAGLGYTQEAVTLIASELQAADTVPQKRIGFWRASYLAAANQDEARWFLHKILQAYLDTTGLDRIHAAESLSKLNYSLRGIAPGTVQSDLEKGGMLAAFVRWGMAIPANADALPDFDLLLRQLKDEDVEMRKLAAYALGFMGTDGLRPRMQQKFITNTRVESNTEKNKRAYQLSEDQWLILARHSLEEDPSGIAYPYLIGAAYSLFPFGSGYCPTEIAEIRTRLLRLQYKQDKSARIELCRALAIHAEPEDEIVLQHLLQLRNPLLTASGEGTEKITPHHPWNQDVQSAAAYALLRQKVQKKTLP